IATMLLLETVLHGWDFAKATGRDYAPDPALGEGFLPLVEQWAEMYRQYDGFGAPVEVPADASALDRALALSGRDPNWMP
ncbi:MAG TPA: TIGR03086 family protein, partial [Phytomonospora sp.]